MNDDRVYNEELLEKKLVREFFSNKRSGFYVEVGANEADSVYSQSYHLESELEWNGVLVEPIDYLFRAIQEKRTRAKAFQVVCTAPDKVGDLVLKIPLNNGNDIHGHATIEQNIDHIENHETRDIPVKAVTLDSILEKAEVSKIDFLSIDVEGVELDVLKGFSIEKYKPELILIEDRMLYLNKHRYLKQKGYKLCKRTGFNNWYAPQERNIDIMSCKEKLRLFKKMYLSLFVRKAKESIKMKSLKPFCEI